MEDVDAYLQAVPDGQRPALERIRQLVRQQVPDATECISYGMPAFKYKGKYLVGYCNFKDHLSIFPGAEAVSQLADQLSGYTTAKGTVQFTPENPLADSLVREIITLGVQRITRA